MLGNDSWLGGKQEFAAPDHEFAGSRLGYPGRRSAFEHDPGAELVRIGQQQGHRTVEKQGDRRRGHDLERAGTNGLRGGGRTAGSQGGNEQEAGAETSHVSRPQCWPTRFQVVRDKHIATEHNPAWPQEHVRKPRSDHDGVDRAESNSVVEVRLTELRGCRLRDCLRTVETAREIV